MLEAIDRMTRDFNIAGMLEKEEAQRWEEGGRPVQSIYFLWGEWRTFKNAHPDLIRHQRSLDAALLNTSNANNSINERHQSWDGEKAIIIRIRFEDLSK